MNDRDRFVAVVSGQRPDDVPVFGFPGAPGMSRGCLRTTHEHLVATGMPAYVGGYAAHPGAVSRRCFVCSPLEQRFCAFAFSFSVTP